MKQLSCFLLFFFFFFLNKMINVLIYFFFFAITSWRQKDCRCENEGYYFSSAHSPRPLAAATGPIYFSTAPGQNYFFAALTYQNYFFTAPNYQNYYFMALLVVNISCISVLSKFQTFQLCILLRLKSRSVRGALHHQIFMGNCPAIGHTFLALSIQWMSAPSRNERVGSV